MPNAPYLLPAMRDGARIGHTQCLDHMYLDGLEDACEQGRLMGSFAEECAQAFRFSRQAQDEYALQSLERARSAQARGDFAPISIAGAKAEITLSEDEQPGAAALVLASQIHVTRHVLPTRARIVGHASHAQAPGKFVTAPVPAARKFLERIGASGARIIVTLLHALEARDLGRGVAVICIGGGEATAIAIERG